MLALGAGLLLSAGRMPAPAAPVPGWDAVRQRAEGRMLTLGGSHVAAARAYLGWAADELWRLHRVQLRPVSVLDGTRLVERVRDESRWPAGERPDGALDLLWTHDGGWARLKAERLLYGPFGDTIPAARAIDPAADPALAADAGEPVGGYAVPWGLASLSFFADARRVPVAPDSPAALLALSNRRRGQLAYPAPPDPLGRAWLSQLLGDLAGDRRPLQQAVTPDRFDRLAAPLWSFLNQWHPNLWQGGRAWPVDEQALALLFAQGELAITASLDPCAAQRAVDAGAWPASVYGYQHRAGTIAMPHFLSIAAGAASPEAARVAIDFLLSPAAQARKADPALWGDGPVLSSDRLDGPERALLEAGRHRPGAVRRPAAALPAPHPSWLAALESEWTRRYAR